MTSKYLSLLLGVMLLTACRPVERNDTEDTVPELTDHFVSDSIVLETAAHIPQEQFEGYELIWSDTETDRAVYIKTDYTPNTNIHIGDTCLLEDIEVTITDIDEQGVYLSLGDSFAMHGMSGTPITYKGVPFAFVSKATSVNSIYAVFY